MSEAKGACPECGGELTKVSKGQHVCQGCGLTWGRTSKKALHIIIAPLALTIIEEQERPLPPKELAELLLERHGDVLEPLMAREVTARGVKVEIIKRSLDAAHKKGLIGKIPPQSKRFCALDHPEAVLYTKKSRG